MKHLMVITLLLLLGHIVKAQAYDSAGVLTVIEAFRISLLNGDVKNFTDLFAEDADFTNWRDKTIHGRQKIYEHHQTVFPNKPATRKNNVLGIAYGF